MAPAQGQRSKFFAHSELGDHLPRQFRGLLEIILGAGRHLVENQLLGHPPAKHRCNPVEQLGPRVRVLVFRRGGDDVPERHPTRQDRHLVWGIGVGQQLPQERVAAFMVRGNLPLLGAQDPAAPLRAGDDPLDGLIHLGHHDLLLIAPRRQQRRLVHQVGQVRPGESRGVFGQDFQIDIVGQRFAPHMHVEDRPPAPAIRVVHDDAPVETAGT